MAVGTKNFYEFSGFRFDAHKLRLNYAENDVELPPKSLEALKLLLESGGEIVTREYLMSALWGEAFVEEANLTVAVSRLRKALASFNGGETFIQTVPRRGYRFVGDAQETIQIKPQPTVIENGNGHAEENRNGSVSLVQPAESAPQPANRSTRIWFGISAAVLISLLAGFTAWNTQADSARSGVAEANEAFAAGEMLIKKRDPCPSIPYFREAVAHDAKFGRAYANLAAAQAMCGSLDGVEENIAKALSFDPRSAEAHATDGFLRTFVQWDWAGAERSLRRAVELDPDSAMAHHWLGVNLSIRGQLGEAQGEMRRAIDLDPQSPLYLADLCQTYYFSRAYDHALDYCGRAKALDPEFGFANWYLRDIHMMLGNEKIAADHEIELQYGHMSDSAKTIEREILERDGLQAYRRLLLDKYLKEWNSNQIKPENRRNHCHYIGSLYTALGDKENALHWLDNAVSMTDGPPPFTLPYLSVDPYYDILHDDPRFQKILKKINLSTGS
ncbi:MAG: winged helix-turn-helix domain-containing protein [Chloracidobacterium sp.]|nr:winged helix-turn-helix domain-containing protein [Chloracidobacterium sp.]